MTAALVLGAGALIAVDRGDQAMHDLVQGALRAGTPVRTNPNVDATVVLLAKAKDPLYTSDPGDLRKLCTATGSGLWSSAVEAALAG